ncbi:MAG: hypothetical protein B1H09_04435 [Gemmatimonadaceae bacterium 4484_173]|nr:MAG: hypothetical protein B1H09_04435 [Gemmatimonadaceae bacterium 4484_173]
MTRTISAILLLVLTCASVYGQEGATYEDGRLILEEITIQGELRTPQALFLMLKSTPNLSNVLLERSFLEDVVRPIYPGAFASETSFSLTARQSNAMPLYVRYGSVAVLGGLSAWKYAEGDSKTGMTFAVMGGLDLLGSLLYDLVGQ